MNSEIKNGCLAVHTTDPSVLEFSTDDFRSVDLHGRRYLLRTTENGDLEALAAPRIARLENGPDLHLSVVLLGPPDPEDIYLSPHVAGGRLSLTVDNSIDNIELKALSQWSGHTVNARVSERSHFDIRTADETLASIDHSRSRRAALETALTANLSRAVMSALSHGPSDLESISLNSLYHWRESKRQRMHLHGSWDGLYNIARQLAQANQGFLHSENITTIAAIALDQGVIHLQDHQGLPVSSSQIAADMLHRVHAMFLQRVDPGFMLREKPLSLPLSLSQSVNVIAEKSVETQLALLPAIKASMAASRPDRHLNITVLGNRRISRSTLPARRNHRPGAKTFKPAVNLSSGHDLIDAQLITRPIAMQQLSLHQAGLSWAGGFKPRSFPVVSDKKNVHKTLLRDRMQSKWQWYIPEWSLHLQDHDDINGAFRFEFEQRGFTANAEPAFYAHIQFELRAIEPDHLKRAIATSRQRGLTVKSILPSIQSVFLEIPYVDQGTGRISRRRLRATFRQNKGRLLCEVQVQHDTVRLAYGALSHPGFQSEPARVHISARFNAYEILTRAQSSIKQVTPRGVQTAGLSALPALQHRPVSLRPIAGVPDTVLRPGIVGAPVQIKPQPINDRKKYKLTQMSTEQKLDMLVPCSTYSQAYRQRIDDETFGIGCLQPLLLGETNHDLVQELADLRSDSFRVYRQLPQPNRFLVLPASYHLTRRLTTEDTAEPALGLYSAYDPARDDDTLFTFDAHLEPNITPLALERLKIALSRYSPSPQLDFPTEVDLESQTLTISSEGEYSFITDGPFLNVSIRANLSEALIIKARLESSGILGNGVFTLADGTRLEPSVIRIALNDIGGPWPEGPIQAQIQDKQLLLTNRAESDQEVVSAELQNPTQLIQLGTVINSRANLPVPLDAVHGSAIVSSLPLQNHAPELAEMRIFSELIRKQVAFFASFDLVASSTPLIEIRATLVGIGEEHGRTLEGQNKSAEIEFELPLTAMLSNIEMAYTIVYRNAQGAEHHSITGSIELSNTSLVSIPPVD